MNTLTSVVSGASHFGRKCFVGDTLVLVDERLIDRQLTAAEMRIGDESLVALVFGGSLLWLSSAMYHVAKTPRDERKRNMQETMTPPKPQWRVPIGPLPPNFGRLEFDRDSLPPHIVIAERKEPAPLPVVETESQVSEPVAMTVGASLRSRHEQLVTPRSPGKKVGLLTGAVCSLMLGLAFLWNGGASRFFSGSATAAAPAQGEASDREGAFWVEGSSADREYLARRIEDIRPGMRVLAANPELEEEPEELEINPAEWRLVHYQMTKDDGSLLDVQQLEPDFLCDFMAVGETVPLIYEELGIDGDAIIVAIDPCPTIEEGSGRVVTATFRHDVAEVLDVYTTAHDEPIGTTANHPFWSVDRQDWVQAGNLEIGEHLQLRDGRLDEVVTLRPRPGPHAVYNLTVDGTHTYHVGSDGVLVHNTRSYGGKIGGYDSNHLAQEAARFRRANPNLSFDRNVAVIEYRAMDGSRRRVIAASEGQGLRHAETVAYEDLLPDYVRRDPSRIRRVFSERALCGYGSGNRKCDAFFRQVAPTAEVSWLVDGTIKAPQLLRSMFARF